MVIFSDIITEVSMQVCHGIQKMCGTFTRITADARKWPSAKSPQQGPTANTHDNLSEPKLFIKKSTRALTRNVRNSASPPPDNFAFFSRCAKVPSHLTAAKATKLSNVVNSLWAVSKDLFDFNSSPGAVYSFLSLF